MDALIAHILAGLPPASAYWVAYSGGRDSRVLLELLAAGRDHLAAPLGAVHVDHQLHSRSADWERHCRETCRRLAIDYVSLRVDAAARAGQSPEAAAREARYRALREWLPARAALLTAQHQDDQAETLLLQLLRGAGPRGLAGMPERAALGRGLLLRPLLNVSRACLAACAQQRGLDWIEDPSNADTGFDRNFLRRRVQPVLHERWPSAAATLARAARHQADQAALAEALAEHDFARCIDPGRRGLSLSALNALAPARQRNLLRFWIERQGFECPTERVLRGALAELAGCRADAEPRVRWPGAELRRYRDTLFLMAPLAAVDAARTLKWTPARPLYIAPLDGELSAEPTAGDGLDPCYAEREFEVRFRRGGERLRPARRRHRHALKKLLQEAGIPAWERDRIPLLYVDDELAAVAGVCVCEGYQAPAGGEGLRLNWSRLYSSTGR